MTNPATNTTSHVVARISGVGVEYVISTETSLLFDVVTYCGPQTRVELPDATWREAMRFVTDEIAAQIDEIVDADLVEVRPGCFLPSREAAMLAERESAFIVETVDYTADDPRWLTLDESNAIVYAQNRKPSEPCERGTIGCPVVHIADESCETW